MPKKKDQTATAPAKPKPVRLDLPERAWRMLAAAAKVEQRSMASLARILVEKGSAEIIADHPEVFLD